ncbi:MAG: hypothetical protein Q9195_007713 [Heterodermia aff. obscurata]
MAPLKACALLLTFLYLTTALATPDSASLARPIFTLSAGYGSANSTALFPTGTGTGFAGPTGVPDLQRRKAPSKPSAGLGCHHNGTHHHPTGHHHGTGAAHCSATSVALPSTLATPVVTPAVQRRLVHVPSGGFSSSNGTLVGPTGTETGAVSATGGAISQPTFTPAVVGRSKKVAWSWWG